MLDTTSFAILPSEEKADREPRRTVGSVKFYSWENNKLTGKLEHGEFLIYFAEKKIPRIIVNPFGEVNLSSSIAICLPEVPLGASFEDLPGCLHVKNEFVEIEIGKNPFTITILNHKKAIFKSESPFALYKNNGEVSFDVKMDPQDAFYGFGEKTGFLNKRGSTLSMWNTDVYAPHNKDTVELYQSIPYFIVHSQYRSYGLFFDNTFRTEFDTQTCSNKYSATAAGGQIDFYVLAGENLKEITGLYTELTGKINLPPKWAIGYHQSRYSYKSEQEVMEVVNRFKSEGIPLDCIFFDIHYMKEYRVFTFDKNQFPQPGHLIKSLADEGIKVVPIVDPGVKKDVLYPVYQEGVNKGYFCKYLDGQLYYGEVWPGISAFPDFMNSSVRSWLGNLHKYYTDLGVEGIWNDMNEPSVFNESKTMDLDVVHDVDGVIKPHLEMHNTYGLFMSKATAEGLAELLPDKRTFVLTRAGYAGIQRYAAVWTGDNRSHWEHLEMSLPMIMNLGMSGVAFTGTDVGGFSSDCTPELLIRWTQVGAFMPYFRNHSVQGSIHQEPWVFGEATSAIVKKYIQLRYKWLPYLYSLFYESARTGLPIVRPLVLEYPEDENTFNCSDQFMLGSQVLIAPILRPGVTHRSVYLPEGNWYDYWTKEVYRGGKHILVEGKLDVLPIFIKEGSIIPIGSDIQNTSEEQTLHLEVYAGPGAVFDLYEDDGASVRYRDGIYAITNIKTKIEGDRLKIEVKVNGDPSLKSRIEQVQVFGFPGDIKIENLSDTREKVEWKIERRC
ncbi:alpha-glucosidase [Bacillus sp. V3-13]|uniref:glycoside hydrolase family 31 protein n=1 Tax=Bacillus sp. V3-13 TaxID=2053728 RepID=UPI000C7613C6|nr:TIM-barrel domain-containing protein [Bacillus sp. V3-13]PLR77376.1 alpha-glucosidase [Bacillus sp. V3-13]